MKKKWIALLAVICLLPMALCMPAGGRAEAMNILGSESLGYLIDTEGVYAPLEEKYSEEAASLKEEGKIGYYSTKHEWLVMLMLSYPAGYFDEINEADSGEKNSWTLMKNVVMESAVSMAGMYLAPFLDITGTHEREDGVRVAEYYLDYAMPRGRSSVIQFYAMLDLEGNAYVYMFNGFPDDEEGYQAVLKEVEELVDTFTLELPEQG